MLSDLIKRLLRRDKAAAHLVIGEEGDEGEAWWEAELGQEGGDTGNVWGGEAHGALGAATLKGEPPSKTSSSYFRLVHGIDATGSSVTSAGATDAAHLVQRHGAGRLIVSV